MEILVVQNFGQKLEQILVVLEGGILDHAHETKGISNLRNSFPYSFEIIFTFCQNSQLFCRFDGPWDRILPIKFLLVSRKFLSLLLQHILDIFVQQELATEVIQLFSNEFVKLSDNALQDTHTMRSYRVQHLVDTNGMNLFGFARFLHENLLVQIVVVIANKSLCFS